MNDRIPLVFRWNDYNTMQWMGVNLSEQQSQLLFILAVNSKDALPVDYLIDYIYATPDHEPKAAKRVIEQLIWQIRDKFGYSVIATVSKIGYKIGKHLHGGFVHLWVPLVSSERRKKMAQHMYEYMLMNNRNRVARRDPLLLEAYGKWCKEREKIKESPYIGFRRMEGAMENSDRFVVRLDPAGVKYYELKEAI